MAKRDKREATIRRNTKNVRFDDLDRVLRDAGFAPRKDSRGGSSHVTYTHPLIAAIVTVVIPHGGTAHVKEYQVVNALAAIDESRVKE